MTLNNFLTDTYSLWKLTLPASRKYEVFQAVVGFFVGNGFFFVNPPTPTPPPLTKKTTYFYGPAVFNDEVDLFGRVICGIKFLEKRCSKNSAATLFWLYFMRLKLKSLTKNVTYLQVWFLKEVIK